MPIRIYLSPMLGNGEFPLRGLPSTWGDTVGPWRVVPVKYIDHEGIESIDIPARRVALVCVTATSAELDTIEADTRLKAAMPARVADQAALDAVLDTPFASLGTSAWRTAARNYLESQGVNTAWLGATDSLRSLIRAILKWCFVAQRHADGMGNANLSAWIQANLDTTVGALPAAVRSEVSDWMLRCVYVCPKHGVHLRPLSPGTYACPVELTPGGVVCGTVMVQEKAPIDTSWITSATTVRQVQNYIATQMTFRKWRFAGGDN